MRLHPDAPLSGEAYAVHRQAWQQAQTYIPQAKDWLVDLTRIENAVAIVTPRHVQEEMLSVAEQAGM